MSVKNWINCSKLQKVIVVRCNRNDNLALITRTKKIIACYNKLLPIIKKNSEMSENMDELLKIISESRLQM